MFSPLLPSALDARTQTFPVLSSWQIDRIRSCSRSRQVAAGDILFEPGDENVPFYVLLSGRMEIVQPDLAGEHLIAKHGPGEFTGEMTMISGRRCLARGRVTEPGEFLELTGDGLRSLVARDAELSDIFMRAFILRRLQLISQGQGNVILLGSRHSANTLRLREFLSRNGYPYRYVDLDTDNTSQELLDRFEVTPSEIPVVICSGRSVLRNPSNQGLADCLGFNTTIDESQVRETPSSNEAVSGSPGSMSKCCWPWRGVARPCSADISMSALAADIAPSPTTRVEIGTARSVRRALANVGSRSVAGNFFLRSTCMWSSRYRAS